MQYLGPREEPDLEVRHCFVIPERDLEVKVPQILARCIWVSIGIHVLYIYIYTHRHYLEVYKRCRSEITLQGNTFS